MSVPMSVSGMVMRDFSEKVISAYFSWMFTYSLASCSRVWSWASTLSFLDQAPVASQLRRKSVVLQRLRPTSTLACLGLKIYQSGGHNGDGRYLAHFVIDGHILGRGAIDLL